MVFPKLKDFKLSFICRDKNCDKKYDMYLDESPKDNVNNNLINDLYTENENLQWEVSHLENIENFQKWNWVVTKSMKTLSK